MGLKDTIEQYVRVLRLARKPSWEEVKRTAKITGLGLAVLGIIGYIIHWVYYIITSM
ncbi:MAG TPA: protein translocase SEC61 complex subunit gamma [Euryarchaeota archaeon]|nr:protein translocase SEC61 complex subunit gamma [Euryarchaeota archaeon]HIQ10338.1 protein translocase SEC61 complex subunit gamma [Euryarchaeota archaeon]